jgi:molecular chaperone IbpA
MSLREEDVEMRIEPGLGSLFRSTVGFDRTLDQLRHAMRGGVDETYLPYDIERTGEDSHRVTLVVAGFRPDELIVAAQQNLLVASGEGKHPGDGAANGRGEHRQLLHRGIRTRAFERRFPPADHVKVVGANLAAGLLTVGLRRKTPEAVRPRRIETAQGNPQRPQRQSKERQAA